jgi:host factor-I protein
MEPANRRLIRPSLVEPKEMNPPNRRNSSAAPVKKVIPPEQTNAENFYYLKQMQSKTPMVFVLQDGETLEGVIEWYDRTCLKIHRTGAPNLLVYKPSIKYLYKVSG